MERFYVIINMQHNILCVKGSTSLNNIQIIFKVIPI
jgi:hypothetical protein